MLSSGTAGCVVDGHQRLQVALSVDWQYPAVEGVYLDSSISSDDLFIACRLATRSFAQAFRILHVLRTAVGSKVIGSKVKGRRKAKRPTVGATEGAVVSIAVAFRDGDSRSYGKRSILERNPRLRAMRR